MDTTHDLTPRSAGDAEDALTELAGADPADAPESAERLAADLSASLEEPPPAPKDSGAEVGEGTS